MKKRLSPDDLLLESIRDEKRFRKDCLKAWRETNDAVLKSSENITKAMTEGFSLIRSMMVPPASSQGQYWSQQAPPQNCPGSSGGSELAVLSSIQEIDNRDNITFHYPQ